MNILLLNGSPKGEKSNSLRLARAFCEGIGEKCPSQVEELTLSKLDIKDCLGCFGCWSKTPGKCVIQDDMAGVIEKLLWADIVVWSFPLYYFGLPSRLKAAIDRQLPMNLPFMTAGTESGGHPSRYDLSGKRYVAVSTCGFYTAVGNYDAVNAQFDRMYGKGGYTTLYCGEGELFRVPEVRQRTEEYLGWVRQAGCEFAEGDISPETRRELETPLFPREIFEQWADASWGVDPEGGKETQADDSLAFTRQMAALYSPAAWKGKDMVVEMCYTDVGKSYQIALQKDGHQVLTENFLPYTTKIETPITVWKAIAAGELNGAAAMMEKRYTVEGDFDLMLRWDEVFGMASVKESGQEKKEGKAAGSGKKANMTLMLLPWMALWILLSIQPVWGGAAGIALSAALPLCGCRWRLTPFEGLTALGVTGPGLWALLGGPVRIILPLSYLIFGVMWTVTAFLPLPLSAYYSSGDYGGDEALENPLFLRTNRILTACWGVLYLLTPVWTYFLLDTSLGGFSGLINSAIPALMGIFTVWFQKWYPKHYAAGGRRAQAFPKKDA